MKKILVVQRGLLDLRSLPTTVALHNYVTAIVSSSLQFAFPSTKEILVVHRALLDLRYSTH